MGSVQSINLMITLCVQSYFESCLDTNSEEIISDDVIQCPNGKSLIIVVAKQRENSGFITCGIFAGCYYELLRTFIEAGESLEREDGFLIHSCQCNVSLADNIWSHDLQCSRSVSTDQRLTVAPKEGNLYR